MDNSHIISINDLRGSDFDWEIFGLNSGIMEKASIVMAAHEDNGAGFFSFKDIEDLKNLMLDILLYEEPDGYPYEDTEALLYRLNRTKNAFLTLIVRTRSIMST